MFFSLTSLSDDCRKYLRHFHCVVRELQRTYRLTLPRMRTDLRVRVYVRAFMQFSICHRFRNWTEMQHEIGGCARDSSPTIPAPIARFVSFCRGCSRDAATGAVGSDTRRFITHVPGYIHCILTEDSFRKFNARNNGAAGIGTWTQERIFQLRNSDA